MKHILIVGKDSYIGTSLAAYLARWPEQYAVDTLDVLTDEWKQFDYSGYDAVYHVAGIVHVKETDENRSQYEAINCDLHVSIAALAKAAGVRQSVYISSMAVYGMNTGVIDPKTPVHPVTAYGSSKLHAEEKLLAMQDEHFKVSILRPPMVYGKGCKGNFVRLDQFARKLPVFPLLENHRSLLYIDNLCELVRLLIDSRKSGIFCPQERSFICTSDMVQKMAACYGRRMPMSRLLGAVTKLFARRVTILSKAFGSLTYEGLETLDFAYCVVSYEDGIRESCR